MTNPPFGFDAPEDSPGFLLWQTSISWQRRIKEFLESYEISHSQFVIMAILLWFNGKQTDVTQTDLINMSKLDKMTVSKSLKKLSVKDLVTRSENASDTRAKLVFLTKEGKILIQKLVPSIEKIDKEFFGRLPDIEQKGLIGIMQKLSKE